MCFGCLPTTYCPGSLFCRRSPVSHVSEKVLVQNVEAALVVLAGVELSRPAGTKDRDSEEVCARPRQQ